MYEHQQALTADHPDIGITCFLHCPARSAGMHEIAQAGTVLHYQFVKGGHILPVNVISIPLALHQAQCAIDHDTAINTAIPGITLVAHDFAAGVREAGQYEFFKNERIYLPQISEHALIGVPALEMTQFFEQLAGPANVTAMAGTRMPPIHYI